jgi:hypothetical protein
MWDALANQGLRVRPFDGTPPPSAWTYSRFDTPLRKTLQLLARELDNLGAKDIVVELDVAERDFRLDGYPRANARALSPAVRVTFQSKWGPLRYETAEFSDWQANLRAIALSMEALRSVDRYGVSKRGEQYRGWRQLPTGTDPADSITTPEQARAVLADVLNLPSLAGMDERDVIRRAQFETHPDRGGDSTKFRKVMKAKELLGA